MDNTQSTSQNTSQNENIFNMGNIEAKTIILEDTADYTRVRTQCNDQNYIRDIFMSKLSHGAAIAACSYLIDMLMDMTLLNIQVLENQLALTDTQKVNLEKLKVYHSKLKTTSLNSDIWQMDWVYAEVKYQQDLYSLQFFDKRNELNLGEKLPSPEPNPVPNILAGE